MVCRPHARFPSGRLASDGGAERCIEIVGEGLRRLPTEFKQRRKDIPWKEIAGTRDHLIHGYDVVDHRILWDAVQIDIPRLIEAIDELLA